MPQITFEVTEEALPRLREQLAALMVPQESTDLDAILKAIDAEAEQLEPRQFTDYAIVGRERNARLEPGLFVAGDQRSAFNGGSVMLGGKFVPILGSEYIQRDSKTRIIFPAGYNDIVNDLAITVVRVMLPRAERAVEEVP